VLDAFVAFKNWHEAIYKQHTEVYNSLQEKIYNQLHQLKKDNEAAKATVRCLRFIDFSDFFRACILT
jgi:glutathionylspermidine synthase